MLMDVSPISLLSLLVSFTEEFDPNSSKPDHQYDAEFQIDDLNFFAI